MEEFKSNIWSILNEFFEGNINWEEVKKRIDKLYDILIEVDRYEI